MIVMIYKLLKKIRKYFNIRIVISAKNEKILIEDIELVYKGCMVRSVCFGCLFNENYTCKFQQRDKLPVSCLDNPYHFYQLKEK
jgi:hypothetical protein